MEYKQRKNETNDEYLKRLFAAADNAVGNIKKITLDMKRLGIIGFCSKCSGNIYKNKKHKCK